MKRLINFVDDIFFFLGMIFLTIGGFKLYPPVGFFVLGACCLAYSFVFARSAMTKRGGG
ncbi:hypothetical protein REC12_20365 [Desulfosporosinus sp. PR]|uniref:hypothetical protein n=1 Tax=Candidatus Desulfosporosinus nitrosoreducens TaxID=3401928 RepID=UPI0027EBAB11|nr:hypothetical protein [Desulfosporosinus sp. PR]MDQ7095952.1 hypothetical protein [Desulfosporosinus sp. PR]